MFHWQNFYSDFGIQITSLTSFSEMHSIFLFVHTPVTSKPKISVHAVLIFVPPEVAYLLWFTELGTRSFASVGLALLPFQTQVSEATCGIADHVTLLIVMSKADSIDLGLLWDRRQFVALSTSCAHVFVPLLLLLLFLCLHLLYFIPSSVFNLQFMQWPSSSCLFSILPFICRSPSPSSCWPM